jgi:drug/metabolite transporter (DMT)-like permease
VSTLSHRLAIVAAAVLFSTGGAAIKASALSGWQIASFRSGVAAVVLAVAFPAARRSIGLRTIGVGVSYAATMILFVLGNKLTTAANTIFLQSTAPLYIALLAPWLLREKTRRRDVVVMFLIAAGMALFFVDVEPVGPHAANPFLGNILSACAGLTWALTLLGLRWLEAGGSETDDRGHGSGLGAVIVGNAMAFAVALYWALPVAMTSASATDWWVIAYLGAIQIGLAYVFLTFGFRHVSALTAALIIFIEPTLNPLWAWLVHGERPGLFAVLGGSLIILTTTGKSLVDAMSARRDEAESHAPSTDGKF